MKKIITLINKNLILVNIFILILASFFYYFNSEKFDYYKTYLDYNLEERHVLSDSLVKESQAPDIFKKNFISSLNFEDLTLISNLKSDKNFKNVNFQSNIDQKTLRIRITFLKKKELFKPSLEADEKKISLVTETINEAIENFHEDLKIQMYKKKEEAKEYNSELLASLRSENIMSAGEFYSGNDSSNIKYMNIKKNINNLQIFLNLLEDDKKIIKIKGYNLKFRRLFLNTDEYIVSLIILSLIFNFFVKNYSRIIR